MPQREVPDWEFRDREADPSVRRITASVLARYACLPEHERHSAASRALWRCMRYYDPGKGQAFTTSLHRFLRWELEKARDKEKKWGHERLVREPESREVGPAREEAEHVLARVAGQSPAQGELLRRYYIGGEPLRAIAGELGIGLEEASRRLDMALETARCVDGE